MRKEVFEILLALGIGDLLKDMAQVVVGLKAAGFRRFNKGVESGCRVDSVGVACKEPVLPSDYEGTDGVFGQIVVCALLRRMNSVGANPTRLAVVPAGSTLDGSGGDEWAEASKE